MRRRSIVYVSLAISIAVLCGAVFSQVNRPYRNGTVWNIAFIRMKPGMDAAYMNYLATSWKKVQEASKKEGLILSYKVLSTEPHTSGDWNLLLMTEYKDMASMEANEPKQDALEQKVIGDDQKQMQGYRERAEIREVQGERTAREIILEPK